jgi:hypothetical protein
VLTVVSTCKGRLAHVQQSATRALELGLRYLLVDYSCPEHSGEWVRSLGHPNAHAVQVIDSSGLFCKPKALNVGGGYAAEHYGGFLLFCDADMLLSADVVADIEKNLSSDTFVFVASQNAQFSDFMGLLAVHSYLFKEVGGYEEAFEDYYGHEDLEFRLRLWTRNLHPVGISPRGLTVLPHDDALRIQFRREKDLAKSTDITRDRMCQLFYKHSGQRLERLIQSPTYQRDVKILIGSPP